MGDLRAHEVITAFNSAAVSRTTAVLALTDWTFAEKFDTTVFLCAAVFCNAVTFVFPNSGLNRAAASWTTAVLFAQTDIYAAVSWTTDSWFAVFLGPTDYWNAFMSAFVIIGLNRATAFLWSGGAHAAQPAERDY